MCCMNRGAFSHTRAWCFLVSRSFSVSPLRTLTHIEITKSEEERGSNGSNGAFVALNSDLRRWRIYVLRVIRARSIGFCEIVAPSKRFWRWSARDGENRCCIVRRLDYWCSLSVFISSRRISSLAFGSLERCQSIFARSLHHREDFDVGAQEANYRCCMVWLDYRCLLLSLRSLVFVELPS